MAGEKVILLTGGCGFIGSHTVVQLIEAKRSLVVVDNLVNSSQKSLQRVKEITGVDVPFHKVDLLDKEALSKVFDQYDVETVIHFAGLKAVGESVQKPLLYYNNNIIGTIYLLEVMQEHNVKNVVFSSSATVYGEPESLPLTEESRLQALNAYGRTKLFIEEIIHDVWRSDNSWNCIILRYFNPVGAHKSGKIGEDPKGVPNNLTPYVAQVAVGKRPHVNVFGGDYDTPDGTGVRDYIHITDLADGHVAATKRIHDKAGYEVFNLGTGKGYSVLDVINAMSKACGKKIEYKMCERRAGDSATIYADSSKANKLLNWKASRDLQEMLDDVWRWQSNNPNGFRDE